MVFLHATCRLAPLMAATAILAGCGGAAEKTTAPTPEPTPSPGLRFDRPHDNVLAPGASQALSVTVNPAPANTTATFTVSPSGAGSTAPVAAATINGIAGTTLSVSNGAAPGLTFRVSATATTGASDALTYYVRPTPQKLQVLVPAYFDASGTSSPWATLTTSAASYPNVRITVIANPNGGILTSATTADSSLDTAITAFKGVTGTSNKVIGYVATASGSSGAISEADVKTTIDQYIRLYPGRLDGFFLDGMSVDGGRLSYFQNIYGFIKGRNPAFTVIGNPGTYPAAAYAGAADTLVTYAGNAAAYQGIDPQSGNTWVYAKDNGGQAMLVHTASTCSDMKEAVVNKANTPRMNTGMVYVTNLSIGAPWSALPTYWLQLLGTVDALNNGVAPPSC